MMSLELHSRANVTDNIPKNDLHESSISKTPSSTPSAQVPDEDQLRLRLAATIANLLQAANSPEGEKVLSALTPEQLALLKRALLSNNNAALANKAATNAKLERAKRPAATETDGPGDSKPTKRAREKKNSKPQLETASDLSASAVVSPPTPPDSDEVSSPPPTTTTSQSQPQRRGGQSAELTASEPVTEIRDGVEWVTFIYSHNRTLRRYTIRTDVERVKVEELSKQFKSENCVYPRALCPQENYQGNRWAYETECNIIGWKLTALNKEEIGGRRGLIQRAVDCFRNRYPELRSRRVARQEKLLNGTLRKRRDHNTNTNSQQTPSVESTVSEDNKKSARHPPKTFAVWDLSRNTRCRIRINVNDVRLEDITSEFKRKNCVFPRARDASYPHADLARWREESECNELGWKLAWLNQRQLANKRALLQRTLDLYRSKFCSHLPLRRRRSTPPPPPACTAPSHSTAVDFCCSSSVSSATPSLSSTTSTVMTPEFACWASPSQSPEFAAVVGCLPPLEQCLLEEMQIDEDPGAVVVKSEGEDWSEEGKDEDADWRGFIVSEFTEG
ncbi:uncharacterized protein VTP21DRAFT_3374 [Calcarisporiella thermophila]|uniref:uncharacterized protein n=1 Tax=Calcarisporiella thermophila TaxID=911321 RepID=UPI00374340B3